MPNYVPDSNQIKAIMKLVERSPEGADYFCQRLETSFKNAGVLDKPVFNSMLDRVSSFRDQVRFNSELGADPWAAQNISATVYKDFHVHLAALAGIEVKHQLSGDLGVEVAVGNDGKILRAFIDGDQPISDTNLQEALDKLFNAWLAENNIKTKGSVLYEATIDGKIRQKEGGGDMVADAKKVEALLRDANKGLQSYFEERGIPTKEVIQRDYSKVAEASAPAQEKSAPNRSAPN